MHFYVLAGITQINDASTRSFNGLLLYNTVTPPLTGGLFISCEEQFKQNMPVLMKLDYISVKMIKLDNNRSISPMTNLWFLSLLAKTEKKKF